MNTNTKFKVYLKPSGFNNIDNIYPVGVEIQFTCLNHQILRNDDVVTCMPNGAWSTDIKSLCSKSNTLKKVTCAHPPRVSNGNCCNRDALFACAEMSYAQGSEIQCNCDKSYELVGDETLVCGQDGRWSSTPECISPFATVGELNENKNTPGIVIVTACSVLGVLLICVVIVVFRRIKPVGAPTPSRV